MSQEKPGIRKALTLSFAQTCISLVLSVATIIILSRLLKPAEIGVYSVAVGFVALVHMLRDFGVSEFVVQDLSLDNDVIRTAFTMNLIIAWCLAAIVFASSGLIGLFYGDPGVARVTRAMSLVFVLLPFGTTHMALMKRSFRFDTILKIRLAETAVRGGTTIGLAYAGFSYMSMAWGSVAGMGALILGCEIWGWQYRVRGVSFAHWRRVMDFGWNRTIADLVMQMGTQSANIIVGKMFGMAAAGYYSRGYGVVNMFVTNVIGAVGNVAFPAYAREHRESNTAPQLFLKSVVYLTGISWPFFGFCTLMAFPIIRIAFGDQWDAAVPLMQWLCGAAIVGTLTFQCNRFFTAVGRYRDVTRVEIQYQVGRIGLTILAAFHSLEAVAASQILVYMVAAVLYYRKVVQYESTRLSNVVSALLPSGLVMLSSCAVPAAVLYLWPGPPSQHYVSAFLVAAAGSGLGWILGIVLTRHPLLSEIVRGISSIACRVGLVSGLR
ncbi:lipopolysaccharide biosynthesis protein [Rhodanobacter glycinis]|uniref:lipopolysaccharide biosynthesis protein n=1 Tax=Rhodanobacter glycinis TaxID=582702 RepID=UPI00112BAB06|nr:lipopolysaccharide biosynthesis protein [Rhodanobacter glycinis]TPG50563.1 lipopolysaccharide biosynthesis protein [Rhodanobacter glycinis]